MRYWIFIQMWNHDRTDWWAHQVCACGTMEDVGIVARSLEHSGQKTWARDVLTEGHPVVHGETPKTW